MSSKSGFFPSERSVNSTWEAEETLSSSLRALAQAIIDSGFVPFTDASPAEKERLTSAAMDLGYVPANLDEDVEALRKIISEASRLIPTIAGTDKVLTELAPIADNADYDYETMELILRCTRLFASPDVRGITLWESDGKTFVASDEVVAKELHRLIRLIGEREEYLIRLGVFNTYVEPSALPHGYDEVTLRFMIAQLQTRRLVILFPREHGVLVRTRTAEIIRLMTFTYAKASDPAGGIRWIPSVSTLRYGRQVKEIPAYDLETSELSTRLNHEIKMGFVDDELAGEWHYVAELELLSQATQIVLQAIGKFLVSQGLESCVSDFQAGTVSQVLRSLFARNSTGKPYPRRGFALTAPVGAGKTLAFVIPSLIVALYSRRAVANRGGVKALLVYPRVALSKDQLDLLRDLEARVNKEAKASGKDWAPCQLRTVADAGGMVRQECQRLTGKARITLNDALTYFNSVGAPDILVSNIDTLRRRLGNPLCHETNTGFFAGPISIVVFDEVHLVERTSGTHIIRILSRLNAAINKHRPRARVVWVGSSATIADPTRHVGTVFTIDERELMHISAEDAARTIEAGEFHHVFLKTREARPLIGTLTNLSSLIIHNRRDGLESHNRFLESGEAHPELIYKSVGFADSLATINRWADLVRDNEGSNYSWIQEGHPTTLGLDRSDFRTPYYVHFYQPLSRRLPVIRKELEHLKADSKELSLLKTKFSDLCASCQRCERREVQLSKDAPKSAEMVRQLLLPAGAQTPAQLSFGNLEGCPFFQNGFCWWFSQDSGDRLEPVPMDPPQSDLTIGSDNIRCASSYRGQPGGDRDEQGVQSPNDEFVRPLRYSIGLASGQALRYKGQSYQPVGRGYVPFVTASPVFEVGINIRNLREILLHKAIRNQASYKQKSGRGGREFGSETLVSTVLSYRPQDHHYTRNLEKLLSLQTYEPVVLKRENVDVVASQLFMTCFDFVASEGRNLHDTYHMGERPSDVSKEILRDWSKWHSRLMAYLQSAMPTAKSIEVEAALSHFKEVLDLLALRPIHSTVPITPLDFVERSLPNIHVPLNLDPLRAEASSLGETLKKLSDVVASVDRAVAASRLDSQELRDQLAGIRAGLVAL